MEAEGERNLAQALRSRTLPPELIVVTTPALSPRVVLEGHRRLTAYALYPEYLPFELGVLLGISPTMDRWGVF